MPELIVQEKPTQTLPEIAKPQSSTLQNRWRRTLLPFLGVTVVSTAIALAYHFLCGHAKTTLLYDARGYLWSAGRISEFLINALHQKWTLSLVTDKEFVTAILRDGPVFPSLFGMFFAAAGKVPGSTDWRVLEVAQSVIHGLSAGLVFLIARQLLDNFVMQVTTPAQLTSTSTHRTAIGARSEEYSVGNSSVATEPQSVKQYSPSVQPSTIVTEAIGANPVNVNPLVHWLPVVSAFAWAIYPAAVINSGRFYTETLLVFVMLSLISVAVSQGRELGRAILMGFLTGIVILMKPALIPAAIASIALSAVQAEKRIRFVLAIVVVCGLTLAPWATYTYQVSGKAHFTTPRNAGYNIAMGIDTEVDGSVVSPTPPLTHLFWSDKQPIYAVAAQWKCHTFDCLKMTCRKITRQFSFPWNDLRQSYFGLDSTIQQGIHLFLILLGASGLFLGAALHRVDRRALPLAVCLFWIGSTFVYLMFEANSRYGFTLMPLCAALLSITFAGLLMSARPTRSLVGPIIAALLAAAVLTAFIYSADSFTRLGQPAEISYELKPGMSLVKTIDMKAVGPPAGQFQALIFVDGKKDVESAALEINGHKVEQPLRHLRYFVTDKYIEFYVFRELGRSMQLDAEDFRQWRAAFVPAHLLHWDRPNTIRISSANEPITVYGDTSANGRIVPSVQYHCPGKLGNTNTGMEARATSLIPTGNVATELSEEHNAQRKRLNSSARLQLVIVPDTQPSAASTLEAAPVPEAKAPSAESQADTGQIISKAEMQASSRNSSSKFNNLVYTTELGKDKFHKLMSQSPDGSLTINKQIAKLIAPMTTVTFPRPSSDNRLLMRLTGNIKATRPDSRLGILIAATDKYGGPLVLSKNPDYLPVGTDWKDFVISDELPVSSLPPGPASFSIAIYPGPWMDVCGYGCDKKSAEVWLKNLKLEVFSGKQEELDKKHLLIY